MAKKIFSFLVVFVLFIIIYIGNFYKMKKEYPIENIQNSQYSTFEYYEEKNDIFLLLTGSPHMDLRDYLSCLQLQCTDKKNTKTENWRFRIFLNPIEYCSTCDEVEILINRDSIYIDGIEYEPEDLETYELVYNAVEQYYFYFKENYKGVVKNKDSD